MIYGAVAAYSVLGLAPGVLQLLMQRPAPHPVWLLLFCGAQATVVVGLVVQAVRRRRVRPWVGAFAALTLAAVVTFGAGSSPLLVGPQPFLWWQVGLAVVCAGVWRGVGTSIAYGLVLAVAWTWVRLSPAGGAVGLVVAGSEGVFGAVSGIVIAVVLRGMLDAAAAADVRAKEVYAVELRQAIDKVLGEERGRLDHLIHDDVMTTLTAAAQSTDADTGRATALLARETLVVVDAPQSPLVGGSLSVSVLVSLARQTVRRVSPDVAWVDRIDDGAALRRVPAPVAESVLAALREAVRNAVQHAHARRTAVELQAGLHAGELHLVARVVDDGLGFDLPTVPASRLGVRVSMLEASRAAGVRPRLRTAPGRGTEFVLGWSGPAAELARVMPTPADDEARLPVDFPTGQFVAAMWSAVAAGIGIGLVTFGRLESPACVLTAMVVLVLGAWLVQAPWGSRQLPIGVAAAVAGTQVALALLMVRAIPRYDQPDVLYWHAFPAELVLMVLVFRRRPGWAVVALLATEAGSVWTCLTSDTGWDRLLGACSAPALFVAIAVLITRVLHTITQRQSVLRRQEDEALDESVRQHVAVVQRTLWMADLRAQSRSILVRLSQAAGPVPHELRREALLLEATLRESLVARNVMSDELALLTEGARRRGVDVRLVDSRRTAVPSRIGQAVLDTVRRALAPDSVSRLVVRLAPEDGATAASVLTEDAAGTHLVQIDERGVPITSEVETRGA